VRCVRRAPYQNRITLGGSGAYAPEAVCRERSERVDIDERTEAILHDCGVRLPGRRDLLLPLARQIVALEVDLSGRTFHDAEYCRLLKAYESALQALRKVGGSR
jgi:hypothetical protein